MKTHKTLALSAGTLMIVTNVTPILAKDTQLTTTDSITQICSNEITASADVINQYLDGIEIESEQSLEPQYVNNEVSYMYVEPTAYTYEVEQPVVEPVMSVDEFMQLYAQAYESMPVDTSMQEEAYQQAQDNYNTALAEYEAASTMIENSKDVEVQVTEEVTDEEGNITQVVRTEIQTVTEMVPAGDILTAQANLDAATSALEQARVNLEAAKAQTTSVETDQTPEMISDVVEIKEPVTNVTGGEINNSISWSMDSDGLLVITGTGPMNVGEKWDTSVKEVIVGNGITSIGLGAFTGCTKLTKVSMAPTVTRIENSAFYGCTSLNTLSIPKNVSYIGDKAFYNTPFYDTLTGDFKVINNVLVGYTGNAANVTIPSNIVCIAGGAFEENTNIKSITIPSSVKEIGRNAFKGCTGLTSITIPKSVKVIDTETFAGCTGLTSVSIPDGVTSIGGDAFHGCISLSSVKIPGTVKTIDWGAFQGCKNLKNLTLSNGLTTIQPFAFSECTGLTNVLIPNTVTEISWSAFADCTSLTDVTIPSSVTNIGAAAFKNTPFYNNQKGDFVIVGDGILYKYKGSSTNVTVPNGVKYIADQAFVDNTDITGVTLPKGVINIGEGAFAGCTNLSNVSIPNTVNDIYENAFLGTPFIDNYQGDFVVLGNGLLFKYKGKNTQVTIPNNVKSINYNAFSDNRDVTSITLPGSVTTIKPLAFTGLTKLTKINIPGSVTTIGNGAFNGCSSLTSITLPEGVKEIDNSAFMNMNTLAAVTLPKSLSKIGGNAFAYDKNLKDVYYQGTEKAWNEKNLYVFPVSVKMHFMEGIPFTDVPEDAWYYDVAKECYETGLINGTSATTFSPMQTMTRAMVVTILWRMDGQPKTAYSDKFKDVTSGQWYANSISWASQNGIVYGYGDGTFKPDAAVTREQIAVMLANYAGFKKVYVPGTKKLNTYPDGSQVSTYAQAGMKWALTNGIVSGDGAGYLRPKKSATRAEGAAMLLRMKNWL